MQAVQRIHTKLQSALQRGGWDLPAKDIQYVTQNADEEPWHGTTNCEDHYLKAVGVYFNRSGRSEQDIVKKSFAMKSAVADAGHVLKCKSSSRKQRFELIRRICQGVGLWSAGVWIYNHRSLSRLRSTQNDIFRKYLRLHRIVSETDEQYARRQNRELRSIKDALSIPDLDVVAARRTYRYAGHVARQMEYDPCRLTSQVLQRVARQNVRKASARQGFSRFSPWIWEGQFTR